MKNFTIYLFLLVFLFVTKMVGQETFENKAKTIAVNIENITNEEKAALKKEVDEVNNQLVEGTISKEEAEKKKKEFAEKRARNIENRVAVEQEKLQDLVQEKVDGKVSYNKEKGGTVLLIGTGSDSIRQHETEIKIPAMKVYNGQDDKVKRESKRTTSQFVFAMGLNSTMADGKLQDSNYDFIGSHFYEWGLTLNSRILNDNNLLHAKYGLSLMYNNLRPTDNRSFVVNGDQTDLVTNPIHLKESRFRNVYLVAPVHLEFDFSKDGNHDGKSYFRTHKGFRMGFGGYAGINVKSKQILKFEDNDYKTTQKTKGDYNVNNFIYGLSSYIGYKEISLYLKYDLNPIFKNNAVDENNISLGIRFDFN
ncbi:hypothetical protein SOM12_06415 [Flavobacterium sp. CFBP9031]|uniref:hypothetical protein n=1 Tax=Flavobacterium sp. CFBP9031 TaxID=3096538 RepID=UPI002A69A6F7|nr:hypothetical protein [Flavobacterium sp. CFBP9031]MDY0987042.1 hypothetical protein [Flavobacterium sp. CFBP9031]